jgi:hypothetical protein
MPTLTEIIAPYERFRAARPAEARYGLTPLGSATVALAREGWLRDVAPQDREPAIYGLCVAIPELTPEDRAHLIDLVAAHQDATS